MLRERLGSLDPAILASSDLEPVFRAKPAIHRFPGAMARRVHDLAEHVCDRYDGHAARVWVDAPDADALRGNLAALPGFGEMKIKALGSVLAKRFGVTRPATWFRRIRRSATSTHRGPARLPGCQESPQG